MTLTIGKFDGVHLGHQALLKSVLQSNKPSIIYTFSNNPSEVLQPGPPKAKIYSSEHKLKILNEMGFDLILSEPFSLEIANQTAEQFLSELQRRLKFKTLVLGYDAKLGKGRAGTQEVVQAIGKKLNFDTNYCPPFSLNGQTVSSSLVKEAIAKADFAAASQWLGRPYSIYGPYTSHLDLTGLCHPPDGRYPVHIDTHPSIATITSNKLHLDIPLPPDQIEVVFHP